MEIGQRIAQPSDLSWRQPGDASAPDIVDQLTGCPPQEDDVPPISQLIFATGRPSSPRQPPEETAGAGIDRSQPHVAVARVEQNVVDPRRSATAQIDDELSRSAWPSRTSGPALRATSEVPSVRRSIRTSRFRIETR